MNQNNYEHGSLLSEIEYLRARLTEAEETIHAIRNGEIDALVVTGAAGEQVYTLKGANHTYRILIETINEGALTLSPEGTILYCNGRFSKMVNLPTERVMGHSFFPFVPADDRERIRELLGQALEGESKGEALLQSSNGGSLPVLFSLRSFPFEGRHLICMVVTELTAQKKDQEKLRNYSAVLEQRNKDLEDFTFIASHDLQEPLRKIQVFSDLVIGKYASFLDSTGKDYLRRLAASANRMQELIQDVRGYSKLTNERSSFNCVDLKRVIGDAISNLKVEIEEAGATIHMGDFPSIEGNPSLIRLLFQNLISNALKYRNKAKPVIRISSIEREGEIQLKVEDNGIGFEKKYTDQIFRPFKRLHGRNEYQGTGMGLAICRKIVERHMGTIIAESKPGKGSTFIINLPVKQLEGPNILGKAG
jgi:PAS domain S-box-containing protein